MPGAVPGYSAQAKGEEGVGDYLHAAVIQDVHLPARRKVVNMSPSSLVVAVQYGVAIDAAIDVSEVKRFHPLSTGEEPHVLGGIYSI